MAGDYPEDGADGERVVANGATIDTPAPSIAINAKPPTQPQPVPKEIGITTLLNRLKQSIASARDFATFLKKRSSLEEDQAKSMKRLTKSTQDDMHKQDSKQGSYVRQLDDVMRVHDRIADNGMQFALSLHQMHEDLNELSKNMENGRKTWKHDGLNAEKRATDAENMMEKAKSRYNGLAEDYDRAKTGDLKGSRRIMKGPKSAAQHEEDLLRKLQQADSDYAQKVTTAKAERDQLLTTSRPNAVKALQDLIQECDSALALQLQKFAAFNEKLILGNGIAVSPINPTDTPGSRSLREIVYDIDSEKDFNSAIGSQYSKIPAKSAEIRYEQHSTLLPKQSTPAPASAPPQTRQPSATVVPPVSTGPSSRQVSQNPPPQPMSSFAGASPSSQPPYGSAAGQHDQYSSVPYEHPPPSESQSYPSNGAPQGPPYPTQQPPVPAKTPPYPTGSAPSSMRGYPGQPASYSSGLGQPASHNNGLVPSPQSTAPVNLPPPLRPVFGVDLDQLFQRDGTAVPMVVYQCMQAVDLFGLDAEGIYRLSGSANHVQSLKAIFDNDASRVDFRNPSAFFHDVNSVAGLLKQFFRDLPDPLLTRQRYAELIEAARIDDDVVRRDTLHAVINGLPDANYATLRAVVLHLNRVQEHFATNRMSSSNISICFAPSLMGSHTGPQIADAGLQARVLDTILANTYQIFDED